MHHPGPPRFCHVGESVELAPRAPDPDATYRWTLTETPEDSAVTIDEGPVVHLEPDHPGTYRAELTAPDGTHSQTVRAFPARYTERVRFSVTDAEIEGEEADLAAVEEAVVIGKFNDFTMGEHWAERDGDEWVFETELPPGTHGVIFAFDGEFDPYATDEVTVEGPGRPRIELDARVAGDELVVSADSKAAPDGSDPVVEFHLDDRDALTEADVIVDDDELRAPLAALPDGARVHAVAAAEHHSVADTLELGGDGTVHRPADAPDWAGDATIYEIFVREFVGDIAETSFAEIERRVPYIESLGVDAVWFTPVAQSPTRHGYHITDLFDTAGDLGTRAEFESLVDRLHEAGISVVFDLVINHTSRDHPAFQFHRSGVPGYEDHYERVPAEADTSDIDWAGDDAPGLYFNWTRIPNVNYDSLAVREWMLDVVDEWAGVVDGFRCDVAWGVPHGFWKEVRERVKAQDSDFLLLDETVPREADFRENEFDVHYDTDFYETLLSIGRGEEPATAVFDALELSEVRGYPDRAVHMRYVENHDEDRYRDQCGVAPLRAAVGATFTVPGAPMIYYGQERGVEDQRGTMRWHDGDSDLTDFHRRLVALRQDHPALRAPGVDPVEVTVDEGDPESVVAYRRSDGEETLVVVLNFGADPATVSLAADVTGRDLLAETDVTTDDSLGVEDIVVTPVE
ncbi:alpha-amylase family glycosyl hydrolase [Haloarcula pelagica]|uniref:alpha-amylase family glycosyl hydrolase n=1 Tax=Haloarcula pelagica TaxID=3033389 RepID=UPI0024C31D28|nr:alpha-amylase family glycosyl hydrolase [Halomicroarcula sp. YJ-61-S]